MAMGSLFINNLDWLVTVDDQRRIIQNASLLIQDGVIAAVGKADQLAAPAGVEVIDGRGMLGLPGLIDSSVAVTQQLGRGAGDFCDLAQYRLERVAAYEAALTHDDALSAARCCMLEMALAGTTCFVDTGGRFPSAIADAAVEVGLRGVIGRACQDVFSTPLGESPKSQKRESCANTLDEARAAVHEIRARRHPRIRAAMTIPWLTGCSDQLAAGVAKIARNEELPIIVSAAASRDEAVMSRVHHSATEVVRLENAGLLGPQTLVSHAGWTGPSDLKLLVDREATVVSCPSSSHRLGTGALENGRFPELLAFGANVALGSGSAMASNFVDVARQLFLFAGGSKTFRLDATIISPEVAIEMVTVRAAAALGMESEIGSLQTGKQGDVVLFRCQTADWVPLINPLQNLVFSSRGGADTVIVSGDIVVRRGQLRTAKEAEILEEGQSRAESVVARANLSSFCNPAWKVH
jgi:5-methylthioadenosine/S-adenosylhomocysteine deaminase